MLSEKKAYDAPQLVVHGDVEAVTQGQRDGSHTDRAFPVNTPKEDITFSKSDRGRVR